LLAALVKKHCAVSNEWIANRLAMRHPAGVSKVVKLYQESKEGEKMMTKHEKNSNPRTPFTDGQASVWRTRLDAVAGLIYP